MFVKPFQFAEEGISLKGLSEKDQNSVFDKAIEKANEELKDSQVVISIKKILSDGENVHLCIRLGNGTEEPIDIINRKALDETSIKSAEVLSQEMVEKVKQHLLAKKTEGVFLSSSGSKFDVRMLDRVDCKIDGSGYLTIDRKRLVYDSPRGKEAIKAENLCSYTIQRLVNEGDKIRIFDDHDLVRQDRKGMFFETSQVHMFESGQFRQEQRTDAQNHQAGYYLVGRDQLSDSMKDNLRAVLVTYLAP